MGVGTGLPRPGLLIFTSAVPVGSLSWVEVCHELAEGGSRTPFDRLRGRAGLD